MNNIKNDMDTKIAAKRWGVTAGTVAKYCAAGLVPGAVKIKKVWKIPYNSIKPLTLDNIVKLLRLVNTLKHYPNLDIDYDHTGLSDANIVKVFQYLVSIGMIQQFDLKEPSEKIPYILKLTQRGLDIIENTENNKISLDNETIIKVGATIVVEVATAIIKAAVV